MRMNHALFMVTLLIIGLASRVSLGETNFAEADALAKIRVLKAPPQLKLEKKRDLQFKDAVQGAPKDTVAPTENAAAEFDVVGQVDKTYQVSFVADSIDMKTGGGTTADEKITVTDFTTDLTSNQGKLPTTEKGVFHVGATRAELTPNQVVGDYEGAFKVRVTYIE